MSKVRQFLFCLPLVLSLSADAADTNSLVWHTATDRVSADVRGESLWPLLEDIAQQTGWHIYVEPDTERSASAKFKDLPSGDALKMLLGDLNFALVPQTNSAPQLYIFTTKMENATRLVRKAKIPAAKHVSNELLVKLKPGADIDAIAKLLGAKVIGRFDKLGIYRLQFADASATDAALGQLQNNSDVADADYNYYFDQPPPVQALASASMPPVNLQLTPPGSSGRVIVGLIDTAVQPLDGSLDSFLLKQISVAGDAPANSADITHGTAMLETLLRGMSISGQGSSSAQVISVDVYGPNANTTIWNLVNGVVQAVNNGANVLNLSLGGSGDSSILDGVIQQAIADGIPVYAAAGNQPVSTPTYPAAIPGVIAVTAEEKGQIASYANYGNFVDLAAPDSTVAYLANQPWFVEGTSVSTAYITGMAAGTKSATGAGWTQIETAMQQKFAVPSK
jgi:Subtilase family